jgi:hypothetical protein
MKRKVIFSLTLQMESHSIQGLLDRAQAEFEAEERREQEMERRCRSSTATRYTTGQRSGS